MKAFITKHVISEGWEAIFDSAKKGSDCYTWHKDGNRVRAELVRYVKADGKVTKTVIRAGWRSFHEV